jgi:hypothetical protein
MCKVYGNMKEGADVDAPIQST